MCDNENIILNNKYCCGCGDAIRKFSKTEDWPNRKYHKKCWCNLNLDNPISYDNQTGKRIINQEKLNKIINYKNL